MMDKELKKEFIQSLKEELGRSELYIQVVFQNGTFERLCMVLFLILMIAITTTNPMLPIIPTIVLFFSFIQKVFIDACKKLDQRFEECSKDLLEKIDKTHNALVLCLFVLGLASIVLYG